MYLHAIELVYAFCDVLWAFEDDLGLVRNAQERDIVYVQVEDIWRQIVANRYFPTQHIVLKPDWEYAWRWQVFAKKAHINKHLEDAICGNGYDRRD